MGDPLCCRGLKAARAPRVRLDVEERRAQLVDLGLAEFGDKTYDDVSIDYIATRAGISKGLLYHYFPNKRAFYAAIIAEAAGEVLACTETDPSLPPLDRLHGAIDGYLSYVREHATAYATLLRSGIGVDPAIARIVDHTRTKLLSRLTDGLAPELLGSPRARLALRGWIGFAEAVSLGWSEAISAGDEAPSQREVMMLLESALLDVVRSVTPSV
ncbi:MAG: tetR [Labilithrix sp.]|nr:tetR [Labilithrix sp.]